VVRGRIDAVYREDTEAGEGYLVVDWKTGRSGEADPLQLAIYRQAWAELHDLPVERVRAAFYFVRSGRVVEPADLPGRQELAALLRVADAPER
jgi:DNA helicase-2/ATP-dependent DNA helicase PcrA